MSLRKIDCVISDSPDSSPREKVEVDLQQACAVVVEGDHEDRAAPAQSGKFPMGLSSLRRLSTITWGKPSKKNSPVVALPTPTAVVAALVTPPPQVMKDGMVSWPHIEFETATPPVLWTDDAADSELRFTYKYPRFYLQDPTQVLDDGSWSFHLAKEMFTTLKHVQDAGPTPTNAWSEPSASTINIRGKHYSKDGIKVASETSMFSVLGVDSFVNGCKHEDIDASLGTKTFLHRWNVVCEDLGWVQPPFL
jgi:hypothetical protein